MQRFAKSRIVVPEMPATFAPRLDILPVSQRRLWPELDAVPSDFVLYGGTGLALQLGHRVSEDFASLVDLAGMKMRVIQVRGSWKDYVDIHTLVSRGIDVPTGLAANAIDRSFDPVTSIRALQFYGDGTPNRVPAAMQQDLTRWAQGVDLAKLPTLHPRRGLSPEGLER
jgi:hypothetical protein